MRGVGWGAPDSIRFTRGTGDRIKVTRAERERGIRSLTRAFVNVRATRRRHSDRASQRGLMSRDQSSAPGLALCSRQLWIAPTLLYFLSGSNKQSQNRSLVALINSRRFIKVE